MKGANETRRGKCESTDITEERKGDEGLTLSLESQFIINDGRLTDVDADLKSRATTIIIPQGVTMIDECAFMGCDELENVIIPEGVRIIGRCAFWWCGKLKSITMPDSLELIGPAAFFRCGLKSVTLPDGLKTIYGKAFWLCEGLLSITIPKSATKVFANAFEGCKGLESIIVAEGNTKYHSKNNCMIETESKKLILGCKNSVIPEDGSVTSISWDTFHGCKGLKNITIPNCITSIGRKAFANCSGITSITIPDGVTSIGECVFEGCTSFKTIFCEATKQPDGWDSDWKGNCTATVVWGYKDE